MKSSKGKGRPKLPDPNSSAPKSSHPKSSNIAPWWSRRLGLLAVLGGAATLGLVLFLVRDDPHRLLRDGEALLERDPRQAELLLERSVAAAGGDFPAAQLLLCEALGRQGRWIEALGCFSLVKDKSAGDGRRLMELSAAALSGGETMLAEQALDAARQASVPEAEVLSARIRVRLALGQLDQALADCRRLAQLVPESAEPFLTEARLLRQRREVLAAATAYRAALSNTQDPAEAAIVRRELVEVLIQEANAVEARREFDQLPATPDAAGRLALVHAYILRLEGRSREALGQVERFLSLHPEHGDALLLRGTLLIDLGEYQSAIAALGRLTAADPFHKEAHYLLGRALLKLGQTERAKPHLETSQKLTAMAEEIRLLEGRAARDPHNAQLQLRLAELYEATGRSDVGMQWRRQAAETKPAG